jgi:hypothetical protein
VPETSLTLLSSSDAATVMQTGIVACQQGGCCLQNAVLVVIGRRIEDEMAAIHHRDSQLCLVGGEVVGASRWHFYRHFLRALHHLTPQQQQPSPVPGQSLQPAVTLRCEASLTRLLGADRLHRLAARRRSSRPLSWSPAACTMRRHMSAPTCSQHHHLLLHRQNQVEAPSASVQRLQARAAYRNASLDRPLTLPFPRALLVVAGSH